jgi:hypothetical protein
MVGFLDYDGCELIKETGLKTPSHRFIAQLKYYENGGGEGKKTKAK